MRLARLAALGCAVLGGAPLAAGGPLVDVPLLPPGPSPIVEIFLNGQGPFPVVVDTGASVPLVIAPELVERLKLPLTHDDDGVSDMERAHMIGSARLDSVAVGTWTSRGVRASVGPLPRSPHSPRFDGVLGLSFFGPRLVTFDFPKKRLVVTEGALPEPDGREVLAFRRVYELPALDLAIGSATVAAHLDTGNMAGAFMLPAATVESLPHASEPVVVGHARTVFNEMEIKSVRLKTPIRLGRHEFPEPTVTYPTAMDIANVGARALVDFVLTVDDKNERVKLTRGTETLVASRGGTNSEGTR